MNEEWNKEIDLLMKELEPLVYSRNPNALIATFLTLGGILSQHLEIPYEKYIQMCIKCYIVKKKKGK